MIRNQASTAACRLSFLRRGIVFVAALALVASLLAACGSSASSSSASGSSTSTTSTSSAATTASSSGTAASGGSASAATTASSSPETGSGNGSAKTPLISSVKIPGTPVPQSPPSGPQPTAPASYSQPVGPFFVYMETLQSGDPSSANFVGEPACVVSGVFQRGERIVFRFTVLDTKDQHQVIQSNAKSVQLALSNGQTLTAHFAQRGGPGSPASNPWSWFATYDIPTTAPLGSMTYTVKVTMNDGTTGDWSPPFLQTGASQNSILNIVS